MTLKKHSETSPGRRSALLAVPTRLSLHSGQVVGQQEVGLRSDNFRFARYLGTITQVPGMSTSGFGDLSSKNFFVFFLRTEKTIRG